jgi:hypothetical protein
MSAQRICVQSKKIAGRRPRTSHATPDREETNFCCAYPKRHSGCWPPPPKNSVDGAGRQRKSSASSTHSGGLAPLLYKDHVHGRIESTVVLPPWSCVATPSPRRSGEGGPWRYKRRRRPPLRGDRIFIFFGLLAGHTGSSTSGQLELCNQDLVLLARCRVAIQEGRK